MVEEVTNIIRDAVDSTIGHQAYNPEKVTVWTGTVVESCLAALAKLQKPFKYIGNAGMTLSLCE